MAPLLARWPLTRLAPARIAPARTAPGPARLDLLLKNNPVLTVSALQAPETVAGLVAAWNPAAAQDAADACARRAGAARTPRARTADRGATPNAYPTPYAYPNPNPNPANQAAADGYDEQPPVHDVGDGIRWHGPIRLTPMLRADAGLPGASRASRGTAESDRPAGGFAYVAEVTRSRAKVPDGRYAAELRRRYPQGIPTGAEAEAWSLVRGLAKRLRGVAHLPGSPAYVPHADEEPLVSEHDCRVYSHEMLPWIVLREILRPLAPDLSREPLPEAGGYILRQRGLLEVRVRPACGMTAANHPGIPARGIPPQGIPPHGILAHGIPVQGLPYAIRDRADDAWPHSVYEFCDMSRANLVLPAPARSPQPVLRPARPVRTAAPGIPDALRTAATLIAEITGGVLLDTDGFPVPIRAISPS